MQDVICCIIASNRVKRSILEEVGVTGARLQDEDNVQCSKKGSLDAGSTLRLCHECIHKVTLPMQ